MEFDLVFWFAQAIGVVALGFSVAAYQSKNREKLLGRQMAGAFVYMAHFSLLSAWTGVAMNALVAVRNWVFSKRDTHAWAADDRWMWFFMALAAVSLYFTWQGYISLLPFLGILTGIYSRWKGDAAMIRFFTIVGCLLWIPYNVVVQSYAGIIVDLVIIGAALWGMWKHDRKPPVASPI